MIIKTAKVIDNVDTEEFGYVKVRILPEMDDFKEDLLPWAEPFILGTGSSTSTGKHCPPEIDSFVWVIITDKEWHDIYYIANQQLDGFEVYSNWASIESSLTDTGSHSYPQPHFEIMEDGNVTYHNTETGEMGVYHNSGTYTLITSDGSIYTYSKTKAIKLYNDNGYLELSTSGEVHASGSTKQLVTHTELNTALQSLITSLNTHVHTSAAPGSPTTPPVPPTLSIDISSAASSKYKQS